MAYKTDIDRAVKIIGCLTPARTVINISPYTSQDFVKFFKNRGFNTLNLGRFDCDSPDTRILARLGKLWESSTYPVIVYGTIISIQKINEVFSGTYSYVYVTPNSVKNYGSEIIKQLSSKNRDKELSELRTMMLEKNSDFKIELEKFIRKTYETNIEYLNENCEIFEDKIMIALI